MKISKWHGLGNDFILTELPKSSTFDVRGIAARLCDRHFGVGADGVVTIRHLSGNAFEMRIYNADGSEPEMCGNATRCVGLYIKRRMLAHGNDFELHTKGGIVRPKVLENGTVRSMAFGLVNTGRKAVTLSFVPVGGTGRLQVAAPQRLAPGQEAMVTLTYDLRGGEPLYGMLSDRVAVTIDGRRSELPVTTNAIGIEPTEEMTAVCEVTPVSHFFGIVEAGSDCTVEVWIANRGRGPMHIRGLQVRRGTTATLTDGTDVEAGRSVRVTVTLHVSEEAYGRVAGGLSFVVNDPARPFREIRLTAETD